MSENFKIDYTTDLVDGRMLTALVTLDNRQFEMTVDVVRAEYTCRSLDGKPIPLQAMWAGYCQLHREAVSKREGSVPQSDYPEQQITAALNDEETADSHIAAAAKPPSELRFSDAGDDQEDEQAS